MEVSSRKGDIGLVVGGDGVFGRYGRVEQIPLLFVGVRSRSATGSKAYMAETYFDELPDALGEIAAGRYQVKEFRRLKVLKNGKPLGEVFTDVYLQRGAESNCIRYRVKVRGEGVSFEEAAIGDGVVVTTSAGSTGYFSYPDRIRDDSVEASGHAGVKDDQVGICHVVPTYTERLESGEHPLRYAVPWGSVIEISITRKADARLYGVGGGRGGLRIKMRERVAVVPGTGTTKVVSLEG